MLPKELVCVCVCGVCVCCVCVVCVCGVCVWCVYVGCVVCWGVLFRMRLTLFVHYVLFTCSKGPAQLVL
jgi:hypothetical protein